jgi:hypothetical protein
MEKHRAEWDKLSPAERMQYIKENDNHLETKPSDIRDGAARLDEKRGGDAK